MADAKKRILLYQEKTTVDNTDYMLIDSSTTGTKKYQVTRILTEAEAAAQTKVDAEAAAREAADNELKADFEQFTENSVLVNPTNWLNENEIESWSVDATYDFSGYIAVKNGDVLSYWWGNNANSLAHSTPRMWVWYDADKSEVGFANWQQNLTISSDNIKYVRAIINHSQINRMIQINTSYTVYSTYTEPYYLNVRDRKNQNVRFVSHQGYSLTEQYGRSIASNYYNSAKYGFDMGECDVRFTSDNVPVCSHDAAFSSGGVDIVIADHTLAELKTYDYYGSKISTLEEVLIACKRAGIGLELDQLDASWSSVQWDAIYTAVKKVKLSNIIWSVFGTAKMNEIEDNFGDSLFVWNTSSVSDLANLAQSANELATSKKRIIVAVNYNTVSVSNLLAVVESVQNPYVYFGVWSIDNSTTIDSYLPYVDFVTSNKISYPMMGI